MPTEEPGHLTPAPRLGGWKLCLVLVLVLSLYYGALQNGLWVPITDADLYLSIARNLAAGQGFQFNGLPVKSTPPGWLLFLAGAMKISASFLFLNLMQMCLVLGGICLFYRILLRLTSAPRAFIVCLTVGVLSHVYHLTFTLHTEGLFCLASAGAILLGLQISEGRPAGWRIPLLLLLCVVTVAVRDAGVLLGPLVAGALLSGQVKPRFNRQWVCAVLSTLLMLGSFFVLRYTLDRAGPLETTPPELRTYAAYKHPIVRRLPKFVNRLPQSGIWFSGLLAEPVILGRSLKWIALLANVAGWLLLALLAIGTIQFLRQRHWVLLGAVVYCLAIIGMCNTPWSRYLVPVAPLLFLGLLEGLERLGKVRTTASWRKLSRAATIALFSGIALCNLPLYAVDVWVLHSDDFYGTYYGGQAKDLISIACYLRDRQVKDGEVARRHLDIVYVNVSPTRARLLDLRGLSFLINKRILTVPREVARSGPDERLLEWIEQRGVRYYIHRPPISPWRVWHFRVPWLQEKVTGKPVGETNPYFELYELTEGQATRIQVPDSEYKINRVPDL